MTAALRGVDKPRDRIRTHRSVNEKAPASVAVLELKLMVLFLGIDTCGGSL
jgi:hypothetical protein